MVMVGVIPAALKEVAFTHPIKYNYEMLGSLREQCWLLQTVISQILHMICLTSPGKHLLFLLSTPRPATLH